MFCNSLGGSDDVKALCVCNCVFTMSDVVDAIQVALIFFIVHVLAFGFHNLDGVMAEENLTRRPAEELMLIFSWVQSVQFTLLQQLFMLDRGEKNILWSRKRKNTLLQVKVLHSKS